MVLVQRKGASRQEIGLLYTSRDKGKEIKSAQVRRYFIIQLALIAFIFFLSIRFLR
jgi:hypothetical protein